MGFLVITLKCGQAVYLDNGIEIILQEKTSDFIYLAIKRPAPRVVEQVIKNDDIKLRVYADEVKTTEQVKVADGGGVFISEKIEIMVKNVRQEQVKMAIRCNKSINISRKSITEKRNGIIRKIPSGRNHEARTKS